MMAFLRVSCPLAGGHWGRCGAVERLSADIGKRRYCVSPENHYKKEEKRRNLAYMQDWWIHRGIVRSCHNKTSNNIEKDMSFFFSGNTSSSSEKLQSKHGILDDVTTDACTGKFGRATPCFQFGRHTSAAAAMVKQRAPLFEGRCFFRDLPSYLHFPVPTKEQSLRATWLLGVSTVAAPPRGFAKFCRAPTTVTVEQLATARGMHFLIAPATTTTAAETQTVRGLATTRNGLVPGVQGTAERVPGLAQTSNMQFTTEGKSSNSHSRVDLSSSHTTESTCRDDATSTIGAATVLGDKSRHAGRALQLLPYVARDIAESPQRRIHFSALLSAALRTPQQQQRVASFLFEELRCRCALQLASLQLLAELLQQAHIEATISSFPGKSYSQRSKSDNINLNNNSSNCYNSSSNNSSSNNSNSSNVLNDHGGLPTLHVLQGWLGQAQEALLHQFGLLLLASNALKAVKKWEAGASTGQMSSATESSGRGGAAAPEEIYNYYYYPTGEEGNMPQNTSNPMSSSSSSHSVNESDSHHTSSKISQNSDRPVWVGKKNFLSLVHALRSIHIHVVPRVLAGCRASFNAILQQQETHQQQAWQQQHARAQHTVWEEEQQQQQRQQEQEQEPQQQQGQQRDDACVAETREEMKKKKSSSRSLEIQENSFEKIEDKIERVLEDFLLRGVSIGLLLSHFELLYHQTLHHMQKTTVHQHVTATAGAATEHQHISSGNAARLSSEPHDCGGKQQQQRTFCTGARCSLCNRKTTSSSGIKNFLSPSCMHNCAQMQNRIAISRFLSTGSSTSGENCNSIHGDSHWVWSMNVESERRRYYTHHANTSGYVITRNAEEESPCCEKKLTPSASCSGKRIGSDVANVSCGVVPSVDRVEHEQHQQWLRSPVSLQQPSAYVWGGRMPFVGCYTSQQQQTWALWRRAAARQGQRFFQHVRGTSVHQQQQKQIHEDTTIHSGFQDSDGGRCYGKESVRKELQQKNHWLINSLRANALQQRGYIQQRAYSSMMLHQRLQHEEGGDHEQINHMATYPAVGMIKRECSPAEEFRAAAEKVHALCCRDLGAAPSLRLFMLFDNPATSSSSTSTKRTNQNSGKHIEKDDWKSGKSSNRSAGVNGNTPLESSISSSDISIGHELAQLQLESEKDSVFSNGAPTASAASAAAATGAAAASGFALAAAADKVGGGSFPSDVIMFPPAVLHYVLAELLKNAMRATLHRWDISQKEQENEEEMKKPPRQWFYEPSIRLGQRYRKTAGKQQQVRQAHRTSGDETALWGRQTSSNDSRRKIGGRDMYGDEYVKTSDKKRGGVDCMIYRTEEGMWVCLSDRGIGMDTKAKKAAFKCLRKRADLLVDAAQRFFGASTNSSSSSITQNTSNSTYNSSSYSSRRSSNSDSGVKKPDFFLYTGSNYGSNWSDVHRRNVPPRGGVLTEGKDRDRDDGSSLITKAIGRDNSNSLVTKKGGGRSSNSAQPKMSGFGVGLVLTRAYMQYFGGDLLVRSTPGEGTDIFLFLPSIEKKTEVLPDHPAQLQRAFEGASFSVDVLQNEISLARYPSRNTEYATDDVKPTGTIESAEITLSPHAEAEAEAAARREGRGETAGQPRSKRTNVDPVPAGRQVDSGEVERNEAERCLLRGGVPAIFLQRSRELDETSGIWKLVWHKPEWGASSRKAS